MDSIYKILESLEKVSEASSEYRRIFDPELRALVNSNDRVERTYGEILAGDAEHREVGNYIPMGMTKDQIFRLIDMLELEGYDKDFLLKDLADLLEAETTPIDHSDDEDGASAEDIASAITRRMMAHPKFGALVREIDIIDLNDAIEDVAQFHQGGDLGTSDVSNMVRDVLKQLKKEDALSEEQDLKEMIGYYTIMLNGKVVARGVRATSEKDAIEQAYMKMGSASKYTGAGRDSFKAVREGAVEEGNEFSGELAKARAAGAKEFEVDGKTYKVDEAAKPDFLDLDKDGDTKEPMKKAAKDKEMKEDYDRDEYDEEGEMAKSQARTIEDAARELQEILDDDENLPEWVQKKITLAKEYIDTARDYMKANPDEEEMDVELDEDQISEKAVSRAQQMAAGAALAAKRGDAPKSDLEGASRAMMKMSTKELEKYAGTKHKGLPKKKTESTTSGSVAASTSATGEGIYGNPSIYEGFNSRVENMITESMNVNVSSSNDPTAEPSISVSATGEDANMLAQLLKLAAVPSRPQTMKVCKYCGDEMGKPEHMDCPYDNMNPMGENFMEVTSEANEANSADNAQTYDMHYLINAISGGLNGPKRQINPNNPGDNPLAMTGLGKNTLNLEESDSVESHLKKLYREFKGK